MNHNIVRIIVLVALLVSGFVSGAQNQVKGSLADAKSGDALLYVNCVLLKTHLKVFHCCVMAFHLNHGVNNQLCCTCSIGV